MRRNLLNAVLLTASLIPAGCAIFDLGNSDRDRLGDARRQWEKKAISDYSFTYRGLCFCIQPATDSVRVVVRADTIESLTYIRNGQPVEPQWRTLFRTIPQLFDFIDSAYVAKAAKLGVTFDKTYGYPASADIDYNVNVVDEEYGFRITSFSGNERLSGLRTAR
jgi:hypothetical protein